ncbi:lysocardiolipin acyltransferase 1 [Halyomorpha halys]|uniref:lysocardiolipin acyltransferase 1 n=1 Tax=Halyomorpha halys TaxID=286706 RepID=UPI0006D4C6D6|nr:lysocardiolipin acyltransferase 1-like [Halyomorpha halys]
MKGSAWRGIVYCLLFYSSIFSGFLTICCPLLPLLLIDNRLYRHAMDIVFAIWELYPVALMEILFGTEFIVSGDKIRPWEHSILIMNHRTRLDWNFLWGAMYYSTSPPSHRLKFILKSPIKRVPGAGWVMQMAGFFYIHRRWEDDQRLVSNMLEYLQDINHTYQVLIFPEGTDLTKKSIARSNHYADINNLQHYTHVLHPKTTGFAYIVKKMKSIEQLDAVYDLTIGYPDTLPETEIDVMQGIFPEKVHFMIKRYSINELPSSFESVKEWLNRIWRAKEDTLHKFYNSGEFTAQPNESVWPRPICNTLHLAVIFWTGLILGTIYLTYTSMIFFLWSILNCIIFTILSFATEGFFHIEIAWFKLKHKQLMKRKK